MSIRPDSHQKASEGKGPSKPATVLPSLSAIVPVLPSPFTWVEAKYAERSDTCVLRLAFPWRSPDSQNRCCSTSLLERVLGGHCNAEQRAVTDIIAR